MSTKDRIVEYLKTFKNHTISLSQLENVLSGEENYLDFATIIKGLMESNVLKPIKSHGTNGKTIPLSNGYRIVRANLREIINSEIQQSSIEFDSNINVDVYYSLQEKEWRKDYPYIKKIEAYLKKNGLPNHYLTAPERSFQLVANEKWIEDEEGKKVLERIKLWDHLKIMTQADPLMLSINPKTFNKSSHLHLAVENKTTFYHLTGSISRVGFTSLIYGAGWRIVANIQSLPSQLGLKKQLHKIYYFGDLDPEGISIWYSLYKNHGINLALPFYKALLRKTFSIGKEGQQKNLEAIKKFKEYFSDQEKQRIDELLGKGGYLPQEALGKEELENIWRNEKW